MQRCFLEKNISTHLACLSFLANVGSQGQVHLWSSPEWMSYSTLSDVWQPGYRDRGSTSWLHCWHDTSFVVCQVEPCWVTSNTELSFLSQNLFYHFIEPSLVNYCYFESTGLVIWWGSVQFSSFAQLCPTLCDPTDCSKPSLPIHHQLPEFTQTHVHWVSDAIQPSHPLLFPSPPALNLSQHQGLFKWVSSSHQVAKVLEFQFQHQSFQWTPRTDLL